MNERFHAFARANNDLGVLPRLGHPASCQGRLGLTLFAQEWRVADDSVKAALELRVKLEWLLEIVLHKVALEDGKSLIKLEQFDLWL